MIDADERLAKAWGNVTQTPTLFLVDRHGNVSAKAVGESDFGKIVALIEGKLAERI